MISIPIHLEAAPIDRQSTKHTALLRTAWDVPLIALAFLQGAALLLFPSPLLIAFSIWWGANTIAHNFIHRPFFSARSLNRIFSFYLSLILGIPQSLWRARHLAHHADRQWKFKLTPQLLIEMLGVLTLWTAIATLSPKVFLTAYIPGYLLGLCLCWLQGKYEHARGTTSHYGRLYNLVFFNDGYHLEHHARPGIHWRDLPHQNKLDSRPSHWPAVLRWLEGTLSALERLVLRSKLLQHLVLIKHERAFRKLMPAIPTPRRIAVVGGGLFPRSLIILKKLYPSALLIGIEADQCHIQIASSFVDAEFANEWFDPARHSDFDLLVIPLAYLGDRQRLYTNPPARHILIHDWLWRKPGQSAIISILFLKRLNLITP